MQARETGHAQAKTSLFWYKIRSVLLKECNCESNSLTDNGGESCVEVRVMYGCEGMCGSESDVWE